MAFATTAVAARWIYPAGTLTPIEINCLDQCLAQCGIEGTTPARPADLSDVVRFRRALLDQPDPVE